jgi:hypothetical protein
MYQATMMPLEECIRQQAGSYGFSCTSRLHVHYSFFKSALAREGGLSITDHAAA